MKKITEIKAVELINVEMFLKQGWSVYGYPIKSTGADEVIYQCMVKYSNEEIGERIVEYAFIDTCFSGEASCRTACKLAQTWIEDGYQPYGPIMERQMVEKGRIWIYQILPMVKYE